MCYDALVLCHTDYCFSTEIMLVIIDLLYIGLLFKEPTFNYQVKGEVKLIQVNNTAVLSQFPV